MKTVTIKVDALGGTKVDADGFVGNSCATATEPFISALGGKTVGEEVKPEMWQREAATETTSW